MIFIYIPFAFYDVDPHIKMFATAERVAIQASRAYFACVYGEALVRCFALSFPYHVVFPT